MTKPPLRIDDQYQGFPGVALGGVTGGLLAQHIGMPAEVILKRPIPTGTPLERSETEEGVALLIDGDVAAQARPASVEIDVPAPVSWTQATAASTAYLGHHAHPYTDCFCCGTNRPHGDGLRIFAGPLGSGPLLAAPWTPDRTHVGPDGTLPLTHLWAAVDCPSIWAVIEAAAPDSEDHVVSGCLALRRHAPLRAGRRYVVVAWPLQRQGETWPAAAAVFTADGTLTAVAHHTLVVTDWGVPLGLRRRTESNEPPRS